MKWNFENIWDFFSKNVCKMVFCTQKIVWRRLRRAKLDCSFAISILVPIPISGEPSNFTPPWHECAILPPLGKKSQILRIWDMTILGSGRLRRQENFAILRFFGVFSKVKVHSKCQIFLACGGLWATCNPSYHIQKYGFSLSVKGFWYQNAPKAQENFRF